MALSVKGKLKQLAAHGDHHGVALRFRRTASTVRPLRYFGGQARQRYGPTLSITGIATTQLSGVRPGGRKFRWEYSPTRRGPHLAFHQTDLHFRCYKYY